MTFTEKLKKLTAGCGRSALARTAGVSPALLNNYVNRSSKPMASAALKIARAMCVPLEWLVDDLQSWPPPPVTPTPFEVDAPNDPRTVRSALSHTIELLTDESRRIVLSCASTLLKRQLCEANDEAKND